MFWTSAICLFIKYVLRIPLRYSEDVLLIGDGEIHGELPYAFFHDGRHEYDAKYGQPEAGVLHGRDPEAHSDAVVASSSRSNGASDEDKEDKQD